MKAFARLRHSPLALGLVLAFTLARPVFAASSSRVDLKSPDGKTNVTITLAPLAYSVTFEQKPVLLDSALGLEFKERAPATSWRVLKTQRNNVSRTWQPTWGKSQPVTDNHRELVLSLEDEQKTQRVDLHVRAFNDGVAIRYSLPAQSALAHFTLQRERTAFRFAGDPTYGPPRRSHFTPRSKRSTASASSQASTRKRSSSFRCSSAPRRDHTPP